MKSIVLLFSGGAMLIAAGAALGQAYPARTVRIIVPFSPGGGTDVLARVVNQKLSETLGQQVVIDNRPGGGANIGADLAAKSAPDGYTLIMVTISHAISASLYSKLSYDLIRDFAPVTLLGVTPHVVVVHPSLPVRSVKELAALAKARPGQLDYASSGSGSLAHLSAALFATIVGAKMNHIPYKGGGPAAIALLGGEAPVGFPTLPSVMPYVKAGKLRALAVTTGQRSSSVPELPTMGEAGMANYEVSSWFGLLAPSATPKEIVARLNADVGKVLAPADMKERLAAAGIEPLVSTPEQYAAFTRSEVEKWARVVKATGAKPE